MEVPKTVKEALELDKKNGTTLWADAIAKEMKDVRVAFKILPDGQSAPIGYQKIPCHMIFDVKMEDFRRKARLIAGGHKTQDRGPCNHHLRQRCLSRDGSHCPFDGSLE